MKARLVSLGIFLTAPLASAENWPQFRGPNAAGSTSQTVPVTWSAQENLAWKTELPGPGSSSPIVWEDAIFLTCYTGSGPDLLRHLIRFRASDGAIVWERTVPVWHPEDPDRGFIQEHGWASNTPVTDGERIYCYFGKAGVHAFDFEGEHLWKAETGSLSSSKAWGSAASPVLHDDLLIVPAGDEARAVLGLDPATGEELWRAEGSATEQTYGTPILHRVDEARTDILAALTGEIWGLNPETGKLRWFASYNLPGNMSNTPFLSEELIIISGGFPRTARVALPTGGKGDRSGEILYDTQTSVSDRGIAFAAEPGDAEPLWEERIPHLTQGRGKPFYASPILAGGRIYAVSRRNGTYVIEPSREGLRILAKNRFPDDESRFQGTPAVGAGFLLLRSDRFVYAVAES